MNFIDIILIVAYVKFEIFRAKIDNLGFWDFPQMSVSVYSL